MDLPCDHASIPLDICIYIYIYTIHPCARDMLSPRWARNLRLELRIAVRRHKLWPRGIHLLPFGISANISSSAGDVGNTSSMLRLYRAVWLPRRCGHRNAWRCLIHGLWLNGRLHTKWRGTGVVVDGLHVWVFLHGAPRG